MKPNDVIFNNETLLLKKIDDNLKIADFKILQMGYCSNIILQTINSKMFLEITQRVDSFPSK